MARPGSDPGLLNALFGLLMVAAGILVSIVTFKRVWMTQTIRELKDLSEAQERRINFLEDQLKVMAEQQLMIEKRSRDTEADNRNLVRRNRELDDRNRNLEDEGHERRRKDA
jgi:septal ring factor EnvC (AmiA/AmiB activator)